MAAATRNASSPCCAGGPSTLLAPPMNNVFSYAGPLWQRFSNPTHVGGWPQTEPGVRRAQAGSRAAKFVLHLEVKGRQARFKAYGCPTAIAVGEWLCEQIEQNGVDSLKTVSAATIRAALEITEDKAHCALLGEDTIRELMK